MATAVDCLAAMIAEARRIVVFTGAGISTESGIPDFRSPGGVWSRMKPIAFDDFLASAAHRREAWRRTFSGTAGWTGAAPNAGHHAVARVLAAGRAGVVITQNVDGLHQASGVGEDRVIELHGAASYAACLDCATRHELEELRGPFVEAGVIPACRLCGGIVKTATISFGQPLQAAVLERAQAASGACDLFLVLGSSLVVTPASALPLRAKAAGAKLAIVNREATDHDALANLVIHDEIGSVMIRVAPLAAPRPAAMQG